MSGGEKQRIGIARALAQQNEVLILDEATAALDPITETKLIQSIILQYPEITMIMITHKYSMLSLFDYIVVMHEGRVVEQGTFNELYTIKSHIQTA